MINTKWNSNARFDKRTVIMPFKTFKRNYHYD
jgi:hypothetical protein